jgi:spermidine dehydrogenase
MAGCVKMNCAFCECEPSHDFESPQPPGDASLGMNDPITRRDFLGSALLASGAVLLDSVTPAEILATRDDFTGYGGVGEYSKSNGNTQAVIQAGHTIRDGVL